jgi:serine phosphatase RsbU (regulator of sigma subunit)
MATADEIKAYEGLTEKNFAQCKELFAHQIAAEVIGKIKVALGIFAVLLTAAGVFSLPAYVDGKVTKQVDEELKRQKDRLVEAQVAFAAQAALFDSRAEEIRRLTDDARSQLKKVDELQSDVLKQTEQIAKLDKMAQEAQGASLKAVGCAKEAAEKAKDVTD